MDTRKAIGKKIFKLFEYWFKKLVDYHLKKWSVFSVLLKFVTLSLIGELAVIAEIYTVEFLEPFYILVKQELGNIIGTLIEVFCKFLMGDFQSGFSYLSIAIKLYLITFFGILEWRKENNKDWNWDLFVFWNWNWNALIDVDAEFNLIKIGNEFWKPNKKWFKEAKQRQTEELHNKKYISDLHYKSTEEGQVLYHINNPIQFITSKDYTQEPINSFKQLKIEIDNLFSQINHRKSKYYFNEKSNHYSELKKLVAIINPSIQAIQKLERCIKNKENIGILNFKSPDLKFMSLSLSMLDRSLSDDSFDLILPKQKEHIDKDLFFKLIKPILNIASELSDRLVKLNSLRHKVSANTFIFHAKAGIGKTHFSLNVVESLKSHFPIFIKGSDFSGNTISIHHGIKMILNLPTTICKEEFLQKLQDFGKKKKKKIVLIIDGLNETTNHVNGFSPIWSHGLSEFIESIKKYSNLVLIVTCRTSYLKYLGLESKRYTVELSGFENVENRKGIVQNYFNYYKIKVMDIERSDLSFFEIPLVLNIFCRYHNPLRETEVNVLLGHDTYDKILNDFINGESIKVAQKQDRPSKTPIINAIGRSSEGFIKNSNATLEYDEFLSVTDDKPIDDIFIPTSIAYELLQSELIFMRDMIFDENAERVVHTFQNIGGFLLASVLIQKYPSAKKLVGSTFFKERLANFNNDYSKHQLATDIMKFLVIAYTRKKDDLINYTEDQTVLNYTWDFIFENPESEEINDLTKKVEHFLEKKSGWEGLLQRSIESILDPNAFFNIKYIIQETKKTNNFLVDLTWSKLLYDHYDSFSKRINDIRKGILNPKTGNAEITKVYESNLVLELVIGALESTIIELRDKASHILLEVGTVYPEYIFEKLFEFSTTKRLYIYERLASISYGICLRKQNDDKFINGIFKDVIKKIYELQFAPNPISPTYHYIVIDSLKHIIDLAVHKEVFALNEDEKKLLNQYQFNPSQEWIHATKEDIEKATLIVGSWHNQEPDPLGKDFVTYTIPRLLIRDFNTQDDHGKLQVNATAQIYRRAINSGYIPNEEFVSDNELEEQFYYGHDIQYPKTKVERLGKKYSWNAFFEYAGYLLNNKNLDVWYKGDMTTKSHYKRLSDIELEPSFPTPKVITEQIFKEDLLAHKSNDPAWTEKEMYDISRCVWNYKFEERDFTLLKGQLIQKLDNSYNVESNLLIDAFLVNSKGIVDDLDNIVNKIFDWGDNIDIHGGDLSRTYFGELYWADTIPEPELTVVSIGKNGSVDEDLELGFLDEYNFHRNVNQNKPSFSISPAVMGYSWGSESKIYPSLRDFIPSPNIGKYLELKSDPKNLILLDKDGFPACKTVIFKQDETVEQSLNYLRTDLLQKYLDDNDLVLMYQIKQHTYDRKAGDGNGDFRGMQFFFPHFNDK